MTHYASYIMRHKFIDNNYPIQEQITMAIHSIL
jgi:hypothetical protein